MGNILKYQSGLLYNLNDTDCIFLTIGGAKGKVNPI